MEYIDLSKYREVVFRRVIGIFLVDNILLYLVVNVVLIDKWIIIIIKVGIYYSFVSIFCI